MHDDNDIYELIKANPQFTWRIGVCEFGVCKNNRGQFELVSSTGTLSYWSVNSIEEIDDVFMITNKEIHASIETKEAFFNLKELTHPKLTTFYIGIYDLLNELNLSHSIISLDNPLIHQILSEFSLNSRFLNITPIGFVYQQYKDLEGFKKWCLLQKNLGLQGIGCITPNQVEIANKIFSEDLEFAKMIVERFEKEGPFTIDGLYVDEPIYKNYKQI